MTSTEPADPADEDRHVDEDPDADEDRHADGNDVDGDDEREVDDAHLQDVDPGAGCTEIWEHLSETRDE